MTIAPPILKVELTAPDISAYRQSNVGIDYVTRLDSGKPGPHVIVQALTHGNELSGAITLDYLFKQKFQPKSGVVSFIFANVAAYAMWDPQNPDGNRYVEEDSSCGFLPAVTRPACAWAFGSFLVFIKLATVETIKIIPITARLSTVGTLGTSLNTSCT